MQVAKLIAPASSPDWSSRSTPDVACPLCEYNLRGLSEPRCPECGYRFEWAEVLDADSRPHQFLFEHHPRRNVWSFVRTKLAGFRPWRFWRSIMPTMPSSPRRLLLYWLLSVPLIGVVLTNGYVSYAWRAATSVYAERSRMMRQIQAMGNDPQVKQAIAQYGSARRLVDAFAPTPFSFRFFSLTWQNYWNRRGLTTRSEWTPAVCIAFLAWPWLTLAALAVFQVSMRRARVRAVHVMRCVLYSCDSALLCGLLVIAILPDPTTLFGRGLFPSALPFLKLLPTPLFFLLLSSVITAAVTSFKLGFAYSRYLRFPHPWAVVVASQLLVILSVLVVAQVLLEMR